MCVMLLLWICVLRCGVDACNAIALYVCYAAALMRVMLLLCICVLRCGVDACNAIALYMCATLRRWCV